MTIELCTAGPHTNIKLSFRVIWTGKGNKKKLTFMFRHQSPKFPLFQSALQEANRLYVICLAHYLQ